MGFLLKRPVFQLEGLVNTPEYLRDMRSGIVDAGYLLDRGINFFILSEVGERMPDEQGCITAPVSQWGWPPVRIRVCTDDLLWRSENRDSIVTVWRLQRRTAN